jgi:hypothetical protein
VLGFLGAAVQDAALVVEPNQHFDLEERLEGRSAHALRVEALLLATIEVLEGASDRSSLQACRPCELAPRAGPPPAAPMTASSRCCLAQVLVRRLVPPARRVRARDSGRLGREVWDLLERPCSLDELASELARRHGIDAQTVARDVRPILERLAELRLVVPVL